MLCPFYTLPTPPRHLLECYLGFSHLWSSVRLVYNFLVSDCFMDMLDFLKWVRKCFLFFYSLGRVCEILLLIFSLMFGKTFPIKSSGSGVLTSLISLVVIEQFRVFISFESVFFPSRNLSKLSKIFKFAGIKLFIIPLYPVLLAHMVSSGGLEKDSPLRGGWSSGPGTHLGRQKVVWVSLWSGTCLVLIFLMFQKLQ